eukprot:CAMPEP_0196654386 /NCGR_PEP_ID=MMETSP1086-20130531/4086_1 /TAXON_ID=77921 /ORGANISM="Cyanoptyche  gloeocystis , Strain SAG4.97" /LENGTH=301 /DNA_ID=CAMNT_0041986111 /DNA_START=228 /DNA_END=1133 /DNA_ORIENTATION=-
MSGEFHKDFTNVVTHLVATSAGRSEKYKIAFRLGKPILRPAWVEECNKASELLPIEPYLLPPFASCVISVTGLSLAERASIQELTKVHGGHYSTTLNQRCTHLISDGSSSEKLLKAIEWGVAAVSTRWFFDSIEQKGCLDENIYRISPNFVTKHADKLKIFAEQSSDNAIQHGSPDYALFFSTEMLRGVLERMQVVCDNIICNGVTARNVIDLLLDPRLHSTPNFQNVCTDLVAQNYDLLSGHPRFHSLPSDVVQSIDRKRKGKAHAVLQVSEQENVQNIPDSLLSMSIDLAMPSSKRAKS